MFAWVTAGLRAAHVPQLSIPELHERISGGSPLVIVDVRASSEYETFHIENSINIPVRISGKNTMSLILKLKRWLYAALGTGQAWPAVSLSSMGFPG